jgi:hypothetical protein
MDDNVSAIELRFEDIIDANSLSVRLSSGLRTWSAFPLSMKAF